jgi:hypothetical protein
LKVYSRRFNRQQGVEIPLGFNFQCWRIYCAVIQ